MSPTKKRKSLMATADGFGRLSAAPCMPWYAAIERRILQACGVQYCKRAAYCSAGLRRQSHASLQRKAHKLRRTHASEDTLNQESWDLTANHVSAHIQSLVYCKAAATLRRQFYVSLRCKARSTPHTSIRRPSKPVFRKSTTNQISP